MKPAIASICHLGEALAVAVSQLALKLPALGQAATTAKALSGDIELLRKAFSPMAIRNVVSDVLRSGKVLAGMLQGAGPPQGDVKAAQTICKDLLARAERELGKHSPSRATYSQALCLGYKVKVAGGKYQGATDDAADMQQRCKDLIGAIQAAYALADRDGRNYNNDSTMLKIFVAPEFYFRGRHGAYDHEVVHGRGRQTDAQGKLVATQQSGIMDLMRQEIDKPVYKHWLFVLGTAIAASKEVKTACLQPGCTGKVAFDVDRSTGKSKARCTVDASHKVGEKSLGAFVENVAFIVKEGEVHTVSKELVSDIDFGGHRSGKDDRVTLKVGGQAQTLKVQRHDTDGSYKSASSVPTRFKDERMGGCIFTVDGVTIGAEVCLDHAATTSSDSSGRLSHAGNIQIQLIPSAGMTIGALRTVKGGIVFNVDGATPHVQVIAGDDPEVSLSFPSGNYGFENATWEALRAIGADFDELDDLENAGEGQWTSPAAPPSAPAGSGSVLLYGPYDIPAA